ncbi:hypothetical protein VBD025_18010 [Virgibacillus flavescens]|uniref:hypothetical protein n=1 Tax=Virgibacillus flavescens TaxID=1611422 RepID=UPI003D33AA03
MDQIGSAEDRLWEGEDRLRSIVDRLGAAEDWLGLLMDRVRGIVDRLVALNFGSILLTSN